jgi:8-oxo-dGTP pyrophosphatase MutT (NUDIX family)
VIKRISGRVVYQNAWMTVREDQIERANGSPGVYGVIDKPESVLILPLQDDGFWLVQQYRYTVGARYWEFPQGTLPDRAEGHPEEVACHELAQETGLRADSLTRLGRFFHAYGMSSQACNVFLATGLSPDPTAAEPDLEEDDLVSKWFPRTEVETMLREGSIADLATIGAYGLLMLGR